MARLSPVAENPMPDAIDGTTMERPAFNASVDTNTTANLQL